MQKKIDKMKGMKRKVGALFLKMRPPDFFSGPTPRSLSRKKWEFSWLTAEEVMVRIAPDWKRIITCKLMYHYMWKFLGAKKRFRINIKEYSFILYEISL